MASLMLLGTLLIGILVAHRRHGEQIRSANARLTAIAAADKLFTKWSEEGIWGTADTSGRFEDGSPFVWRWSIVSVPELQRFGAAVGRLEIFAENQADSVLRIDVLTTDGTNIPLARGEYR